MVGRWKRRWAAAGRKNIKVVSGVFWRSAVGWFQLIQLPVPRSSCWRCITWILNDRRDAWTRDGSSKRVPFWRDSMPKICERKDQDTINFHQWAPTLKKDMKLLARDWKKKERPYFHYLSLFGNRFLQPARLQEFVGGQISKIGPGLVKIWRSCLVFEKTCISHFRNIETSEEA